jgi:hypothetical protein
LLRGAAIGGVCAAGTAVIAIPILLWGSERAPEFYGAFTAAIVAAVAVVLGAYYQAFLVRRRDDELRKHEQFAEATDLCYWLDHAAVEMDFIANVLLGIGQHLSQEGQSTLDWPPDRYSEVVTSQFMNDLLARARAASRLPKEIAGPVAQVLYRSFTAIDRVHRLRGVPDAFRATADHVAKHEELARFEADRLRAARRLLEAHISARRDG